MKKQMKGLGFYAIIILIIWGAVYLAQGIDTSDNDNYNLNQLVSDVKENTVDTISVFPNQETPTGEVKIKFKDGSSESFYTENVGKVVDMLDETNIPYKMHDIQKPHWIFTTVLPYIFGKK